MIALLAQAAGVSSTTEVVLFVLFGGIAIGAGIAMVAMRNVVHGALMLVVNLLALAGLYLVLQSSFLSIIQVIVYAGAIMVLFLFVIMLLGIDRDDLLVDVRLGHRLLAVLAAAGIVAFLAWGMIGPYMGEASLCGAGDQAVREATVQGCAGMDQVLAEAERGSVEVVARDLFTRWTFPFEAAALLLVVATIGAMLLGRRQETHPDDDPAWATDVAAPTPPAADAGHDEVDDPDTGDDDGPDELVAVGSAPEPEPVDDGDDVDPADGSDD